MTLPIKYVIWDLDNCLSDDKWREPLIRWDLKGNDRYHGYNLRMEDDKAHHVDTFKVISLFTVPVFFTGRCQMFRQQTVNWIERELNCISPILFMRENTNQATPAELKQQMLRKVLASGVRKEQIVVGFDDVQVVVSMYRDNGIHAVRLFINEEAGCYAPSDLAPVKQLLEE